MSPKVNKDRQPLSLSKTPMASNLISSFPLVIAVSFLVAFSKTHVQAKDYAVGDDGGWDQGINYLRWSQKYNFTVGDVLVFSYVKGQHNVYQVTENTYRSCDSSSGVKATYDTGSDRVSLTEATRYWFICDTDGHCKGGMKFGVEVRNGSDGEAPPSSSPSRAPDGNGVGGWRWRRGWRWGIVFGLLSFV